MVRQLVLEIHRFYLIIYSINMNVMNISVLEVISITKILYRVTNMTTVVLWKVRSEEKDYMASFTYLNEVN